MQAERLVRREVDLRVVETRSELFELRRQRLFVGELREQEAERASGDLGFDVTEDALSRRIERNDVAGLVDGNDDVLDVIEDGLQLARGALAQLARQIGRLVGHELHRTDDAAPLVVGTRVSGLDGSKQPGEVDLAVRRQRVLDLLVEQSMHRPQSRQKDRQKAACQHRPIRIVGRRARRKV